MAESNGFPLWMVACIGLTTAFAVAAISGTPMKLTLNGDGTLFLEVNPGNNCKVIPVTPGSKDVLIASKT